MGWAVLSRCVIEFNNKEDKIKAEEKFKELAKREGISLYEFVSGEFEIMFDVYGNKVVDYSIFDELYEWCKEQKIKLEINCNEFVEDNDNGYYRNSFEEDDEMKKCKDCGRDITKEKEKCDRCDLSSYMFEDDKNGS